MNGGMVTFSSSYWATLQTITQTIQLKSVVTFFDQMKEHFEFRSLNIGFISFITNTIQVWLFIMYMHPDRALR